MYESGERVRCSRNLTRTVALSDTDRAEALWAIARGFVAHVLLSLREIEEVRGESGWISH